MGDLRNVMWDSDVDFDLAAFHALVRALKRTLRQLVEGALAHVLLKDLGARRLLRRFCKSGSICILSSFLTSCLFSLLFSLSPILLSSLLLCKSALRPCLKHSSVRATCRIPSTVSCFFARTWPRSRFCQRASCVLRPSRTDMSAYWRVVLQVRISGVMVDVLGVK